MDGVLGHAYHAMVIADPFSVSPPLRKQRYSYFIYLNAVSFLGMYGGSLFVVARPPPPVAADMLARPWWFILCQENWPPQFLHWRCSASRARYAAMSVHLHCVAACLAAVLGAGCWVLGAGCWVLGAGCWVLGAGCWVLVHIVGRCALTATLLYAACPCVCVHRMVA